MDQIQYEEWVLGEGRMKGVVERTSGFQVLEVEQFLVITRPSLWVAEVEQS